MTKQWITFDLDGTLMQNPFGKWVFPEIAQTVSGKLGRPYDTVAELVAEHERRMRQGRYVEAYDWDEMLEGLCARLGIEKPCDIESLVQKHCVHPKVHLLESGIAEALEEMKKLGFSLAVVTNGFYKYQAPVMEALGLLPLFEAVITPERVGTGKPDPAVFRTLPGEVFAHVGDRLDHDVQLANKCNVVSVLIERSLDGQGIDLEPERRATDQRVLQWCLDKWGKESGETHSTDVLPDLFTPRVVVFSVRELLSLLREWKGG
ncbi:HAD family hydrolase [Brevibacillus panacihumi]|uniref:HAD family hydrolase n=1 Tax=Brevibacillus panacihumi TaxID=497735 RepID=A0A3M8D7F4_9BACL|nr:HAD family hydrolase [Brevibacillus panacihumi]RNB83561.1 HAD family hydrolase [Brevibacillus panacihumi]